MHASKRHASNLCSACSEASKKKGVQAVIMYQALLIIQAATWGTFNGTSVLQTTEALNSSGSCSIVAAQITHPYPHLSFLDLRGRVVEV